MTRFTAINLSELPVPPVIETLDVEAIFARKKAKLLALVPSLADVLEIESEPLVMYLQADAYDELMLRAHRNDGAKSVMLAFATGAELDQLGAFYGVARQVLSDADPNATPPVMAVLESDGEMRARIQLALEAQSTAGPSGSYLFFARSASPEVKDAAVRSTAPGRVDITVLGRSGDGTADAQTLAAVDDSLNDEDVRPLCDTVVVTSATIVPFAIVAELIFEDGPDMTVALAAADAQVRAYVEERRLIGEDIPRSALIAALHQPGVHKVNLTSPLADIAVDDISASFCTSVTLNNGGVNV